MTQADKATLQQLMIDSAYEGLVVVDETLRVIEFNPTAQALLGEDASAGALLSDMIASNELIATLRYVLENREQEFEVQTTLQDRFYRVRTRLSEDPATRVLLIGIAFQDVTELVRLNRARRDMVANISHELRTPIANIRLIIDSLFHDADKPKRKRSIQSLRDIARETDALQWLVHELMDLSMIESGQAIVRMVDVAVADVAEQAIVRMSDQAASRDIQLVTHLPEGLVVLCDQDLVRRVLINLLHNALKFAPPNSAIVLSAVDKGEYIVLTVTDEGPGVPKDQTARVFERFYQVDSSRSKGEGTGLGLAICRHIVEAHGGKIWADPTEIANGGRFSFTLLNANYSE